MRISVFCKGGQVFFYVFLLYVADLARAETPKYGLDFYGSARIHLDIARVDAAEPGEEPSFVGARDAYSRVGVEGSVKLRKIALTGTLELSVNTADFELGDPSFFDDQLFRLVSVNIDSTFGEFTVGKAWLPYYNAVAAPVDVFSSVYAGFSTYAFFRENLVAFASSYKKLDYVFAAIERTGNAGRGVQATLTYPISNWTLAAGTEIMEGAISDTAGLSASWEKNAFYLGLKFEHNTEFGEIYNVLGQYEYGRAVYKLGVGLGDQFAGTSVNAGADFRFRTNLIFFAELYAEELNFAILREGADSADEFLGAGGFGARQNGRALAIGLRYDF